MNGAVRLASAWCLAAMAAAGGAAGQLDSRLDRRPRAEQLVRVRVIPDAERVGPGGTFHVAVVFDIEPGWHIYWKNPGDGALGTQLEVEAPAGFEVGTPLWARPEVFETDKLVQYAYKDRAAVFVPVKAPAEVPEGRAEIRVDVRFAVCKEYCLLGELRRGASVETGARPADVTIRQDPLLERCRRCLPRPLDREPGAKVSFDGTTLTLEGPARGRRSVRLFPDPSPGVEFGAVEVSVQDDRFIVRVPVELQPRNSLGEPMVMAGLVALGEKPDDPCYDFALPARGGAGR